MRLYNGLVKLDKSGKIKDLVVLDDNFSLKAFFFNPLWFLFHKMWWEFFCFIGIFLLFSTFKKFGFNIFALEFFLLIMISLNAKFWLLEHLVKNKKYRLFSVVFAKSRAEAKSKLINQICADKDTNPQAIFHSSILNPKTAKRSRLKYFIT